MPWHRHPRRWPQSIYQEQSIDSDSGALPDHKTIDVGQSATKEILLGFEDGWPGRPILPIAFQSGRIPLLGLGEKDFPVVFYMLSGRPIALELVCQGATQAEFCDTYFRLLSSQIRLGLPNRSLIPIENGQLDRGPYAEHRITGFEVVSR